MRGKGASQTLGQASERCLLQARLEVLDHRSACKVPPRARPLSALLPGPEVEGHGGTVACVPAHPRAPTDECKQRPLISRGALAGRHYHTTVMNAVEGTDISQLLLCLPVGTSQGALYATHPKPKDSLPGTCHALYALNPKPKDSWPYMASCTWARGSAHLSLSSARCSESRRNSMLWSCLSLSFRRCTWQEQEEHRRHYCNAEAA